MPASVSDQRRPAFCYQTHAALDAIRERYTSDDATGSMLTAIAVYVILTEAANRDRGEEARNGFSKERVALARLAGISCDTFDRYIVELEAAGVVAVERRREGKVNLPNVWVLTDPPGRTDAARGGRTDAAEDLEETLEPKKGELEPKSGSSSPATRDFSKPPKRQLLDIGGEVFRDVPFDRLAETTGATDRNAAKEVAVALNGSRGLVGIRQLAWDELTPAAREAYAAAPKAWELYVATQIVARADAYRNAMPGAMLTPGALAKWWGRVEGLRQPGRVLSDDEMNRLVEEAQR